MCCRPAFLRSRIWCEKKGSPAISIRSLGTFSVIGRRRVARPPARMGTGSWSGDLGSERGVDEGLGRQREAVEEIMQEEADRDAERKTKQQVETGRPARRLQES